MIYLLIKNEWNLIWLFTSLKRKACSDAQLAYGIFLASENSNFP